MAVGCGALNANQAQFLTDLAKLAYGHGGDGEKEKGGKGYMGLVDVRGQLHMVKFCTHWDEVAKGKADCLNASLALRKSIGHFLREIFGGENGIPKDLQEYAPKDKDVPRSLLSRKMVADIVTKVQKHATNGIAHTSIWNAKDVTNIALRSASKMGLDEVKYEDTNAKYRLNEGYAKFINFSMVSSAAKTSESSSKGGVKKIDDATDSTSATDIRSRIPKNIADLGSWESLEEDLSNVKNVSTSVGPHISQLLDDAANGSINEAEVKAAMWEVDKYVQDHYPAYLYVYRQKCGEYVRNQQGNQQDNKQGINLASNSASEDIAAGVDIAAYEEWIGISHVREDNSYTIISKKLCFGGSGIDEDKSREVKQYLIGLVSKLREHNNSMDRLRDLLDDLYNSLDANPVDLERCINALFDVYTTLKKTDKSFFDDEICNNVIKKEKPKEWLVAQTCIDYCYRVNEMVASRIICSLRAFIKCYTEDKRLIKLWNDSQERALMDIRIHYHLAS